ncbi:hypothetical protein [Desulfurispora thermophila]|uniref:hypothetical protein n=1 Tax=Desulfurispora thermophila TaxID=265470 RepID=UPI0003807E95|nr:hypothetical protein [Desulfurispora thermophila]
MSGKHVAVKESRSVGLIKAFIYLIAAGVAYYLVFTHARELLNIMSSKTIKAPLVSMSIVVVVAYLYGTAVAQFIKHTLEEKLSSQNLREE